MAVYVDDLTHVVAKEGQAYRVGLRNGHRWCHMWADSLDELHAMADTIGLRRSWFQNHASLPHYDLTPSRRAVAIRNGAVAVGKKELLQAIQKHMAAV